MVSTTSDVDTSGGEICVLQCPDRSMSSSAIVVSTSGGDANPPSINPADRTDTSSEASSPPTRASRPKSAAAMGDLHKLAVHTKRTCTSRVYPSHTYQTGQPWLVSERATGAHHRRTGTHPPGRRRADLPLRG